MAVKKKVVEIDTLQATTSVKELRQQLKSLKDQMLSTTEGTKDYNDALQKAAGIQHTLKELMEEVNASAMDFGQIAGNVVKATGGLVSGILAAKATMNLFGVENETVIKSLQQMQNLMAITQAIPALDDGVKAFKRLGLVIKSATAGMNGFKAALVSTGLGALAVALGALVANWDEVTDAMKRWGVIHQTTADKLEEEKKKAEDLKDKLDKARQSYADWEKQNKINNLGPEAKKKYDELSNTIDGAVKKLKEFEAEQAAVGDNKEKWNALREQAKEYEKIRDDAAREQAAILASADATKLAEEATKKQEEAAKKAAEELKKLQESYAKLTEEISLYNKSESEKALIKLEKEEKEKIKLVEKAEKNTTISEQKIKAIKEYYAKERANIEKKYADEELNNKQEKSFKELELLENNYKLQEAALQASLDDKEIDLEYFNERKKLLDETYKEDYVSTLKAILEDETLNTEQRLRLYKKLNELRNPETTENTDNKKSLTKGITEAINASALALNDFSDNPAWGNILKNVATLTANWDELNKQIKDVGPKAFSAYAQIAATSISAVAQMLNGLAAEQDSSNKEGFESAKKYHIAGATMSMLAGIASAWASSMQLKFPVNVIIGGLLSGMMLATGIAQIQKIKSTQFNSGSNASGSSATPNASAVASIQAPVQYTQDVQGTSIESAIKDTRVYVTEGDISSTQKRVDVAESEARF